MSTWERFVYVLALAFWKAYWEMRTAAKLSWKEPVNAEDAARLARFRDAVRRLREQSGGTGPVDPPPAGG